MSRITILNNNSSKFNDHEVGNAGPKLNSDSENEEVSTNLTHSSDTELMTPNNSPLLKESTPSFSDVFSRPIVSERICCNKKPVESDPAGLDKKPVESEPASLDKKPPSADYVYRSRPNLPGFYWNDSAHSPLMGRAPGFYQTPAAYGHPSFSFPFLGPPGNPMYFPSLGYCYSSPTHVFPNPAPLNSPSGMNFDYDPMLPIRPNYWYPENHANHRFFQPNVGYTRRTDKPRQPSPQEEATNFLKSFEKPIFSVDYAMLVKRSNSALGRECSTLETTNLEHMGFQFPPKRILFWDGRVLQLWNIPVLYKNGKPVKRKELQTNKIPAQLTALAKTFSTVNDSAKITRSFGFSNSGEVRPVGEFVLNIIMKTGEPFKNTGFLVCCKPDLKLESAIRKIWVASPNNTKPVLTEVLVYFAPGNIPPILYH